jgi:hypothetical protein
MSLSSAWSVFLDVDPSGGAAEAGRAAASELSSGSSVLRYVAERWFLEHDPTGEARRLARSTWSSMDAIVRDGGAR